MAKACAVQLNEFYSDPLIATSVRLSARMLQIMANYLEGNLLPKEGADALRGLAKIIDKWVTDAEAGNMTNQHVFTLCYYFSFLQLILQDYPEVWELYVSLMPRRLAAFMDDCC